MGGTTIAAIATPAGQGGVGIVRVSGPAVDQIATAMLGSKPAARVALYREFLDSDQQPIDQGIVLYFPEPGSFTGENVLEIHGHGGPVVLRRLLRRTLELGAQLARPGEFTERAFHNGKLDLAQAEAVADLIASGSDQAARAALQSLQGRFSARVEELVEGVTQVRIRVESAIDFAEEEIDFLADSELAIQLDTQHCRLKNLVADVSQGQLLRDGLTIVIAGRANAGKSSLLNALVDRDSAIVTEIPGTTRDVLRESLVLGGVPLTIIDTAGLRTSSDPIEQEGIRRAGAEITRADRLLWVIDGQHEAAEIDDEWPFEFSIPDTLPVTRIYNKIDLLNRTAQVSGDAIWLSAKTGEGVELLREYLLSVAGFSNTAGETQFTARQRHADALSEAGECLIAARQRLAEGAGELVAEELRLAQRALGTITGDVTSDDLLGKIFATFCIGK